MDAQQLLNQSQQVVAKLPQKQLSLIAVQILLLVLVYQIATLTWQVIPVPEHKAAPLPKVSSQSKTDQGLDINTLTRLNLFGRYDDKPKPAQPVTTDAPQTRLRLTLTGVVLSSETKVAGAIIENSNRQETYGIGEQITGTRAVLRDVLVDRVIIEQSGRMETLMLEGETYSKVNANLTNVSSSKNRDKGMRRVPAPEKANNELSSLRDKFSRGEVSLTDYIAISPMREGGNLTGFRLRPGRDPKLFKSVGLQPGDIATQLNGLDLTDLRQSAQAFRVLKTESSLNMTILRGEEVLEISISL